MEVRVVSCLGAQKAGRLPAEFHSTIQRNMGLSLPPGQGRSQVGLGLAMKPERQKNPIPVPVSLNSRFLRCIGYP